MLWHSPQTLCSHAACAMLHAACMHSCRAAHTQVKALRAAAHGWMPRHRPFDATAAALRCHGTALRCDCECLGTALRCHGHGTALRCHSTVLRCHRGARYFRPDILASCLSRYFGLIFWRDNLAGYFCHADDWAGQALSTLGRTRLL